MKISNKMFTEQETVIVLPLDEKSGMQRGVFKLPVYIIQAKKNQPSVITAGRLKVHSTSCLHELKMFQAGINFTLRQGGDGVLKLQEEKFLYQQILSIRKSETILSFCMTTTERYSSEWMPLTEMLCYGHTVMPALVSSVRSRKTGRFLSDVFRLGTTSCLLFVKGLKEDAVAGYIQNLLPEIQAALPDYADEKVLEPLRCRLSALDQRIMGLLGERFELTRALGFQKSDLGIPVFRGQRWQKLLSELKRSSTDSSGVQLAEVFTRIHLSAVDQQMKLSDQ